MTGRRVVGSGHPVKSSSFTRHCSGETAFASIEAIEVVHAFGLRHIARCTRGQILDALARRHIAIGVTDAIDDHRTIGADEGFRDAFHCRVIADVVETVTCEEAHRIARCAMRGRYGAHAHARGEIDIAVCGALALIEVRTRLSRGHLRGTRGRVAHHVRLTICAGFAIGHHTRFTDFRGCRGCRGGCAFAWTALHHAGRVRLAVERLALILVETISAVGDCSFKYRYACLLDGLLHRFGAAQFRKRTETDVFEHLETCGDFLRMVDDGSIIEVGLQFGDGRGRRCNAIRRSFCVITFDGIGAVEADEFFSKFVERERSGIATATVTATAAGIVCVGIRATARDCDQRCQEEGTNEVYVSSHGRPSTPILIPCQVQKSTFC